MREGCLAYDMEERASLLLSRFVHENEPSSILVGEWRPQTTTLQHGGIFGQDFVLAVFCSVYHVIQNMPYSVMGFCSWGFADLLELIGMIHMFESRHVKNNMGKAMHQANRSITGQISKPRRRRRLTASNVLSMMLKTTSLRERAGSALMKCLGLLSILAFPRSMVKQLESTKPMCVCG